MMPALEVAVAMTLHASCTDWSNIAKLPVACLYCDRSYTPRHEHRRRQSAERGATESGDGRAARQCGRVVSVDLHDESRERHRRRGAVLSLEIHGSQRMLLQHTKP